jgi:hypothetical protein
VILGVDGGIETCGWAVVTTRGAIVDIGVVISPRKPKVDITTDRARRVAKQSAVLREVALRYGVTTIAAEAVSLGGPPKARLSMGMCLSLCWGSLVSLALGCGATLLEVRPKLWQSAIQDDTEKIDYDSLFAALTNYIHATPGDSKAAEQLSAIAESHRNHAIDGAGVGVFAALRPHLANVIVERRTVT